MSEVADQRMRAERAEKLAEDRLAQMQADRKQALRWRDALVNLGGKAINKGGRPQAHPGLRRVNVPVRLPAWLVQWMSEQPGTPARLIEAALLKAHKLRAPREP